MSLENLLSSFIKILCQIKLNMLEFSYFISCHFEILKMLTLQESVQM